MYIYIHTYIPETSWNVAKSRIPRSAKDSRSYREVEAARPVSIPEIIPAYRNHASDTVSGKKHTSNLLVSLERTFRTDYQAKIHADSISLLLFPIVR